MLVNHWMKYQKHNYDSNSSHTATVEISGGKGSPYNHNLQLEPINSSSQLSSVLRSHLLDYENPGLEQILLFLLFNCSLTFEHLFTHRNSYGHSGSRTSFKLTYLLHCNLSPAFYVYDTQTSLTLQINNQCYFSNSQLPCLPIPSKQLSHQHRSFDETFVLVSC